MTTHSLFRDTSGDSAPKRQVTSDEVIDSGKPVSVYLTREMRQAIAEIMEWSGETRHAVLQYAVKRLINDWYDGKLSLSVRRTLR